MRFPFGLSPKPKAEGPQYVDLYARSVAAALDVSLLFFVLYDLFQTITDRIRDKMVTGALSLPQKGMTIGQFFQMLQESHFMKFWIINFGIQTVLLGVLIVSCQIAFGTTPGKWLMGIKVVDAKTLDTPSPRQFILRFLGYIVAVIPAMIGMFWISFNRDRRGWHDMIAGTVVLDLRPSGWYWDKMKKAWRYVFKKEPKQELPPVE